MKTPNPILPGRSAGITLLEVVVIIFVVVVLAGIFPFVVSSANKKGRMHDSFLMARSLGTAFKMYAGDNDGRFPFARLDGTPLGPSDFSNRALENIMPMYSTTKKIFINKTSAWCRNPAVDKSADSYVLKRGQNDWNCVVGLTEKNPPHWPLFMTATISATDLTYTNDTDAKGGVWGGTHAVIVYVDGSARVEPCDGSVNVAGKTKTFPKRPDTGTSIFTATPAWLGPGTFILAPE